MLDIDFFKRYNDHYGHQMGDNCLIQVSKAVKSTIHRSTDLVARYGGEEFVVVLPNTNLNSAIIIAKQIQKAIQALAIAHACSEVGIVSISLGVASQVPATTSTAQQLIASADLALYAAKQQGRNCYALDAG